MCSLLPTIPLLERLQVDSCSQLDDTFVKILAVNCPWLKELHMSGLHQLTDECVEHFSRLKQLEVVDVSGCSELSACGLSDMFVGLHQLRDLEVSKCLNLSDATLNVLARGLFCDLNVCRVIIRCSP